MIRAVRLFAKGNYVATAESRCGMALKAITANRNLNNEKPSMHRYQRILPINRESIKLFSRNDDIEIRSNNVGVIS